MLDDIRRVYESNADVYLPNWRGTDKNRLCFDYTKATSGVNKDAILSAVISKFWYVFDIYARRCIKFMSAESSYDMYIDSIKYILEKAVWDDENSTVYNDKNAPEKCLIVCMKSRRLNKIRDLSRHKEIVNLQPLSIEKYIEDYGEYTETNLTTFDDKDSDLLIDNVHFIISNCLKKKQYFRSLMIYLLSTSAYPFDRIEGKHFIYDSLRNINEVFCAEFAKTFEVDLDTIKELFESYKNLSKWELRTKINNAIAQLKNCTDIREMLNAD